MKDDLLAAWRTNQRITLLLLEAIDDAGLGATLSTRGGRDVARQLAHLHDVRVWHLEKRAQDVAAGLTVFASQESPPRAQIHSALLASGEAMERFLAGVLAGEKGRRGFKKGVFTTLAYFVAHESHHRGNIVLTLKQTGHRLDPKVAMAIWDWDRR